MKKVKLVAFDVNGTLFDDTKIFWEAINGIFPRYGKPLLPLEILQKKFGQPWTRIYREYGITEEMASDNDLYKIYNEFYESQEHPAPAVGLKETLGWLKSNGLLLAIVSTQQNTITAPLLGKYGLHGLFFKIFGSVSDKSQALHDLAVAADLSASEVAYVGDQEGDVRHAKSAGCVSIAFCGGLHDHERLKKMKPDFIIESMPELKDLAIF
ncbi:MAG: HAD family hydrolase [Candidatus Harrisonbacteria bacterium]|nr:HAD family hydrolase [Candidatus Harrisonbacteria bacterium]